MGIHTRGKKWVGTWIKVIQWDTGKVAWSLYEEKGGFYKAVLVDSARNRILVHSPSALEMRSLGDGDLVWQGTKTTEAADIPGTNLVALAHGNVIRLVRRDTGEERRRIKAGGKGTRVMWRPPRTGHVSLLR
jgi:hypothetical protein